MHAPLRPVALLVLALVASAALVTAQCNKPPITQTGLPTTNKLDVSVTYSDGYKTLANLTHPTSTHSCGWPLVVFVHGYGGTRSVQRRIASRGYAVITYDVRGQGDAKRLNRRNRTVQDMTFYGAAEKYDLAEIIAFARNTWKGIVHPSKVAVTGSSQGGIHSWFAAAYSGKKLTINGRGTITFPKIDAVVPWNFVPEVLHHLIRGDTLFTVDAINRAYGGNTAAELDATFIADFQSFFAKQDPKGLMNKWLAEPGRPVAKELQGTTVPILYSHAWFDNIQTPREAVRVLSGLNAKAPVRSMLSTQGHGSAQNNHEADFRDQLRTRWLDRYLWDIRNGVETEARAVGGVTPIGTALADRKTLWQHRFDNSFQPADLATERGYLTSSGQLATTPSNGTPTTIQHSVPTGYTPAKLTANVQEWQTDTILKNFPLSERSFALPALTRDRELGGSPKVSLMVVPSATRFHLAALLMAKFPGVDNEQMLASWGRGLLGVQTNTPVRVEFDLSPTVVLLPKGTVLRLVIRNHWLREAPMIRRVVTAPYFVSCTTQIRHGTGSNASFVELPFRREVRVGLVTSMTDNQISRIRDAKFDILGGTSRAGKPYLMVAGLSGHVPGTALPGGVVPVQWDPLSSHILGLTLSRSQLLTRFFGTLGSDGRSNAICRFSNLQPVPRELFGLRMTFAAWVYTSSRNLFGRASNPVDILFN